MLPATKDIPQSRELDQISFIRAQRGDESAFRKLVVHYQKQIFSLLWRILGNRGSSELVEDLAQETFLGVYRSLTRFDPNGSAKLSTWVLTIATRAALKELRRSSSESLTSEHLENIVAHDRADAQSTQKRIGEAVQHCLNDLHVNYRAVFVLREYHELDYAAIADTLGIEAGTVKSRLSRARKILRDALTEIME